MFEAAHPTIDMQIINIPWGSGATGYGPKTESMIQAQEACVYLMPGAFQYGRRGYLENLRHGHFRWREAPSQFQGWSGAEWLAVVESDGNVSWDLLISGRDGTKLVLTSTVPPVPWPCLTSR